MFPDPSNPVPVFFARRLCKTYVMGEIEVHALRDVDLEICQR
jgi:putative ABC transport system ATP-binding protein